MRKLLFALAALLLVLTTRPALTAGDVVLRTADAAVVQGAWMRVTDPSAAGGERLHNPDHGQPRAAEASAWPVSYFELTFTAEAATPYRIWIRGKAQDDSYENDSVWLQFSDSTHADGTPRWRIGTTSSSTVIIEDCPSCGLSGWGWQDNGFGGFGDPVYFASSGTHTIRVQVREDGLSIDQIVLSPATYFNVPPGATKNDTTILTGGVAAPVPPPPPATSSLVREPYLQQVGSHSAVILWATREPGPAAAQVGAQTFPARSTHVPAWLTGLADDYYQHEAVVTGLSPSTTYAYRLMSESSAVTDGSDRLTTAPPTGTGRARFVVFGDSGTGSPDQHTLAARLRADNFDLALHTGDIAYGSVAGTGDASYATYQAWFFDVYRDWLRRRPFFPSMGNHDSRASTSWGRAYLDLFALPVNDTAEYPDDAERYYSFDYGPLHVVVLDTELSFQDTGRRAAQLAWLERDLIAAAGQPWKIAIFHRSPFTAGQHHGSDAAVRQAFTPLFERHGVQLSISAHEHLYERTVPWRTTPGSAHAVTYLVTGGGGAPVYPAGHAEWTARTASAHHYARVTVEGCHAVIEAVGLSGSVLDHHVLDRCAQAADAAAPWVSFAAPAPGSHVSGVVTIDAIAADDMGLAKVDLWVDGHLHASDTQAPYAFSWDARAAAAGAHTLTLRAHDIGGRTTDASLTVVAGSEPGGFAGLPDGWHAMDIGAVALAGTTTHGGGSFTVTGNGADIWGTSDAFHFAFVPLSGDGTVTARVANLSGSDPWTKAGVMIRASAAPDAAYGYALVSLSRGLAFQRRPSGGTSALHTAGAPDGAPQWVRLSRTGTLLTASTSVDGTTWTVIGSDVVALPATALVGLAVTSHSTGELATGMFDSVTIVPAAASATQWRSTDVGPVGPAGASAIAGDHAHVTGAGADIWGTSDAFHFLSRPLTGDGAITARVGSVTGSHRWTKAGVMMRSSLDPASPHAFMFVSASQGLAFQRRRAPGDITLHTGLGGSAPVWVRLTRTGDVITAEASYDGSAWITLGSEAIAAGATVEVGLAVTSHDASQLATAAFDAIAVSGSP